MTAANYGYRSFVANLKCSLQQAGNAQLLVASLDDKMNQYALEIGASSVLIPELSVESAGVAAFGSKAFATVTKRKLAVVRAVLETGVDVLFTDGDIFWCGLDLTEFFRRDVDLVAQRTKVGGRVEYLNSGLYYVSSTDDTLKLFDTLMKLDRADDQKSFNEVLCARDGRFYDSIWKNQPKYCVWREHNVTAAFLPEQRFPLGCTMLDGVKVSEIKADKVRSMCRNKELEIVHFSCWSSWRKSMEMKKRGMWLWNEQDKKCDAGVDRKNVKQRG